MSNNISRIAQLAAASEALNTSVLDIPGTLLFLKTNLRANISVVIR
jgi:hypothetical protein